ncbi:HypC/HybG/HupF family hydrogenase formation chaperone [bacterium]|nr:HypC/HybG/HupF family hydrogenase formation chaperone [bacterium]
MCLAVPSKVVSLGEGDMAEIDVLGVRRDCSVKLTPGVKPGDYVLVHAGFAIQIIEEQDAAETLRLLAEAPDLFGDEFAGELAAAADSAQRDADAKAAVVAR